MERQPWRLLTLVCGPTAKTAAADIDLRCSVHLNSNISPPDGLPGFAREPWLAIILAFGILAALGGLFLRLNAIAFGAPRGPTAKAEASYVPMFAHLALVFMAGIYMPAPLVKGFENVARLLG
jgi:hypothetical protein